MQRFHKQQSTSSSTDFLIQISFRQRATWQGEIEWLNEDETPRKMFFRSLLEMIFLMQEALRREHSVVADDTLYSWEQDESTPL